MAFAGITGSSTKQRLQAFAEGREKGAKLIFCVSPQIEILQQLVFMHASDEVETNFENAEDFDNLCNAILMTWDLMHRINVPKNQEETLAILIQDRLRWRTESIEHLSARAYHFYQLHHPQPSEAVQQLYRLFRAATSSELPEYLWGGLAVTIKESLLSPEQLARGWGPSISPIDCDGESPLEAKCLQVFHDLRCAPPEVIAQGITQWDGNRTPDEFCLIGLRSFPIVDLSPKGRFVNNLTTAFESMFGGVRHAILSAIKEKRITDCSFQDLGKHYGDAYEQYVLELLGDAFGNSLHRIPEVRGSRRADGIIVFSDCVVVFEVKAKCSAAVDYLRPKSIAERTSELESMGIGEAASQIAASIGLIRESRVLIAELHAIDWTRTIVVPVVITLESLPRFPGCGRLYDPLTKPITDLGRGLPTAAVRFLDAGDIELIPDLSAFREIGNLLLRWSNAKPWRESSFRDYLAAERIKFQTPKRLARSEKTIKHLVSALELDDREINWRS